MKIGKGLDINMSLNISICRKLTSLVILFALGLRPASGQANPPFDSSVFGNMANIQFNGYTGAEVLTNFPVLIKLGTNIPGFEYDQFLSPASADLRFVSDGTNELNYEIDTWNPGGESYVWVQMPALNGSGTQISAYWGKAGLTPPDYTTNGATWSNGYLGVWHLNQPNAINSANGFIGTAHGNTTTAGLFGAAQYFNTNTFNTYLELGNLHATNLTIEAWTLHANPGDYGGANVDDVVFRKAGSFQWYQWNVDWNLQLDVYGSSTFNFQQSGIFDLTLPAWSYEVVSYDSASGTGRGYMNGVLKYSIVKGANMLAQNNNVCTIGYNSGGSGSYYGSIDEVRLSNVTRSDQWLQACCQNQTSPDTFATFSMAPKLRISRAGETSVRLSWTGTDPVLQWSPTLGFDARWSTNELPAIVVSNGINQVTVPVVNGSAFYRLAFLVKDFTLTATPDELTIAQAGAGSSAISVTAFNGFNNLVSLVVSNLPSGVTAFFSPASTATGSALSFEADSSASIGSFPITISGTSGVLTHTTNLMLNITATATGSAYTWPGYSPDLNYDFRADYPALTAPTNVLDDCPSVAGTVASNWWCFRYGPNKNPLVTAAAWNPLLARMNKDFAYFRDVMGWPPDKRAKRGYYSSIYLFGSGLCTDDAPNTALGGWQGSIHYQGEDWPMVLISYYPVYCFDPACSYGDRDAQQADCVHEGIHSLLADMPGCKQAAWFQEGGNTWLQGTSYALQTTNYSSMGWLSAGAMLAPFMPIECYSGWLQDGSFGGPSAEGVNVYSNSTQLCTWRNLLGGNQYGETFPHFMGECVSAGSVAWIWQNCTGRVLEGLATAPGGLGDVQTRRLIKEFRARQVMCDFGRWSAAYKLLLNNNWGASIHAEYTPYWINCSNWTATCYVITTNASGTLTPEHRTLPGWSGANQIPLTVSGSGTVSVNFQPLGTNMSCQLVYRATDNSVVYGIPVASGTCSLTLAKPVKNNVVIAVIVNTDYVYNGESTRTNKFDYRLALGANVTGAASVNTKWFN